MYKIKNGKLYENEKPVFGIGVSYYPSFHHAKFPVPPEGDRIGEMKKDLQFMKEAGFNLVRTAALGDVSIKDGKVNIDTNFIDEMLTEADKVDIATSVRLQGYSMNLNDNKDFYMLNEQGNEMDTTIWYDFIQNSLYHNGILKDNDIGTYELAKHFSKFSNMVAYQTYNEPHYPCNGIFDYHPDTIAQYRIWLVDKGLMSSKEAEKYSPPTRRPYYNENITEWVNWRTFAIDSMSNFLNHSAKMAKTANSEASVFTCLTTDNLSYRNALRGVDYFACAEGMDILGITHYVKCEGASYFSACLQIDQAVSAATMCGKQAWIIEYDARTNITDRKFNQQTYLAIGAGVKGILYYQWRGDCPQKDGPESNGFGFLNYDGSKAKNYSNAIKMVSLLNNLSPYIISTEKYHSGVAILVSNNASFYFDAIENNTLVGASDVMSNRHVEYVCAIYKDLRKLGISVDLVNADGLSSEYLNIKALYIPTFGAISDKEKEIVEIYAQNGGIIFNYTNTTEQCIPCLGYEKYKTNDIYEIEETLNIANISPIVEVINSHSLFSQVLKGDRYYVVSLNNISLTEEPLNGVCLKLNMCAKNARFIDTDRDEKLEIIENKILLPQINDGAILILS